MNKTELVDTVAKSTGLTKSDTKKTIDAVFEQIPKCLTFNILR
ncbi:HU family DNA-binding protein [Succinivibrio dextrinosolvens]|uniref:DNA-binding protein n=1 Tax=Succinivibrio dextrinosolvens TaxID=83771 RepID=A0A662ZF99_9GAMM|nr:DNA-binding protein [Succinivibrio dextrinosolvens]